MASAHSQEDEIQGINITPLVDVCLVLLVIVLVTAKAVVAHGMPMDLPAAASAGEVQSVLTIDVDASGHLSCGGQELASGEALRGLARGALAKDKDLRAVIAASSAASHGVVLDVLDDLRLAGVSHVAFAAKRVEKQ